MTTSFFMGLILIALGCLPGSLGWSAYIKRWRFLRRAVTTTGTVTEIILRHQVDGHTYQPIITFTTQNGEKITLSSLGASNPPRFRVGQEVPLVYDPQRPYGARVRSIGSLWFATLLFAGIGSALFLIGLALMLFNKN